MPDDNTLIIDPSSLTYGEMEDWEEASGQTISDLASNNLTARGMRALVWIIKRRTDPNFSLEDARNLKMADTDVSGPSADPTNAAGTKSSRRSASSTK